MIQLPKDLIQLDRYPGYYWDHVAKKLYSCKSGVLKELKLKAAYRGPLYGGGFVDAPAGYNISVGGIRRKLTIPYLCKLKLPEEIQQFPIERK